MCVIAQLPHVMLLAATLWQRIPTSLWKCVFGLVGQKSAAQSLRQHSISQHCVQHSDSAH
jgi:hypothetical protein